MTAPHPIDDRLPALMRAGRPFRGTFCGIPSPALIEMAGYAGFEFVIIDNEHGTAGIETTEHMLRAARASGIPCVVRCFESELARTLDAGASGVQVPQIESADQARRIVAQVKYPPLGRRGVAFSTRAAGFGAYPGAAHVERSNNGVALVLMVETRAGVDALDEILAVPGIDAIFIGPNDLSHSLGFGADFRHPEIQSLMERMTRRIATAGVCPGILSLNAEDEARYVPWGARYLCNVAQSMITRAFREGAAGK